MLGGLSNTSGRTVGSCGWVPNLCLQKASADGWIVTTLVSLPQRRNILKLDRELFESVDYGVEYVTDGEGQCYNRDWLGIGSVRG